MALVKFYFYFLVFVDTFLNITKFINSRFRLVSYSMKMNILLRILVTYGALLVILTVLSSHSCTSRSMWRNLSGSHLLILFQKCQHHLFGTIKNKRDERLGIYIYGGWEEEGGGEGEERGERGRGGG